MTRTRVMEAKWFCYVCPAKGLRWLKARDARKCGRHHMENVHGISITPKIKLRKIKR